MDPAQALDLDLAIAARARADRDDRVQNLLKDGEDGGGFYSALLLLVSDLS